MSSPPPPPPPESKQGSISKGQDDADDHVDSHNMNGDHKQTHTITTREFHTIRINNESTFRVPVGYEKLSVIGSGSYGLVVQAHDTVNDIDVAIKKVANVFASKTDAKRVLRELELNSILGTCTKTLSSSFTHIMITHFDV